jgi:hypothetical protein
MNYSDIKTFSERCETHPDHQRGMVTERDIQRRLGEEIDELREYIENIQNVCNTHPNAPHGFLRNASHNAGRYVCECEHWEEPNT